MVYSGGTVSSIIANYKVGLEDLDFDSIIQLAVEARQHGFMKSNYIFTFHVSSSISKISFIYDSL
jgi:hypothetical protein